MRTGDNRFTIVLGVFAGITAAALLREPAQARSPARAMRIGVIKTLAPGMPTALLAIAMRPFRAYMEEQTGSSGEISRGGNAFELAKELQEDKVQVGIFHGHEFAWAKEKFPSLEPIVVCINPLRSVRAYLVVNAKNTATSYADLHGQTIALPRDNRDHCRLYFEHRCVKAGSEPETFYRKIVRPSDTEDALDDVASGRVQAAIVDAIALDRYRRANVTRGQQLRTIQESEAFPPGIIACDGGRLPAGEAKKLREALLQAKDHPRGRQTLQLLKLSTFEAPAADLETSLKEIAKAYPAPAK